MITVALPLTQEQASVCVIAADRFGVEPWEIAAHVLAFKRELKK